MVKYQPPLLSSVSPASVDILSSGGDAEGMLCPPPVALMSLLCAAVHFVLSSLSG